MLYFHNLLKIVIIKNLQTVINLMNIKGVPLKKNSVMKLSSDFLKILISLLKINQQEFCCFFDYSIQNSNLNITFPVAILYDKTLKMTTKMLFDSYI